jgi:hypothetical protein
MSHRLIRDERGKPVRMVVEENRRRLFDDLAALFLEGVSWRSLETELYQRFGHVNERGERWAANRMYAMMTNPTFWGHSAQHFRYDKAYAAISDWIFEPGHEIPPGVEINYNTHEAVYSGELAENIKAEFRRRQQHRGSRRSYMTQRFSGLLLCGECGYHLTTLASNRYSTRGLRCKSHFEQSVTRPDCSQSKWINEKRVEEWLGSRLEQIWNSGDWSVLFRETDPIIDKQPALETVEGEIDQTEDQIRRMIVQQARQSESLHDLFDDEIKKAGERLGILKSHREALRKTATQSLQQRQATETAIADIGRIGLDAFWKLPMTQ